MPWGVTNMELDPPEDCRGTSRRNFLKTSAGVAGDPGGVYSAFHWGWSHRYQTISEEVKAMLD